MWQWQEPIKDIVVLLEVVNTVLLWDADQKVVKLVLWPKQENKNEQIELGVLDHAQIRCFNHLVALILTELLQLLFWLVALSRLEIQVFTSGIYGVNWSVIFYGTNCCCILTHICLRLSHLSRRSLIVEGPVNRLTLRLWIVRWQYLIWSRSADKVRNLWHVRRE